MTASHDAHDAKIVNKVIIANCGAVAGHCIIEDNVIIGGLSRIHQFVRIGHGAIIGAVTMVTNDVIPFGLVPDRKLRRPPANAIIPLAHVWQKTPKSSLQPICRHAVWQVIDALH